MRLLLSLFLAGYVASFSDWMGKTPAFNDELRVPLANGEVILEDTGQMYSEAEYLFAVGHSYVYPDLSVFLNEDALLLDENIRLPTYEDTLEGVKRGIVHLNRSLSLSPGNGAAWAALAWGNAITDAPPQDILDALRRSWTLTPNDRVLADRRLSLVVTLLSQTPEVDALLSPADRLAIEGDKVVLRTFDPRTLADIETLAADLTPLE